MTAALCGGSLSLSLSLSGRGEGEVLSLQHPPSSPARKERSPRLNETSRTATSIPLWVEEASERRVKRQEEIAICGAEGNVCWKDSGGNGGRLHLDESIMRKHLVGAPIGNECSASVHQLSPPEPFPNAGVAIPNDRGSRLWQFKWSLAKVRPRL